ncbi:ROK family transcriptional regulator [Streptomyces sp. ISL-36]|uniref:ROK family transcriptional regulator n=1 Tax=Streptomyces sp. ISL-36 TaxID=2819182 RepID=UPI001BE8001A|nr:ROK family transcriptional regulator [Streptomyces sp. ISL-36]MBT2442754.1 ROK family transcriptional regulator [Streptomyces sp. ISL-36]
MKKTPRTGGAHPGEPKADKASVRRHNLSLVLRTVHEAGETTRASVAARVGLTRAAVSSLVEQLLEHGFLVESGKTFSGQAGRPGTVLKAADTGPAGLGVEINVDYVSVCVVDLAGADRVRVTEPLDNRTAGAAEVLERAARVAAGVLGSAAERDLHPVGVRLALPGLVSAGTVHQAPNLGWNKVDADRLFASALGVSWPEPGGAGQPGLPVASDNEANVAALAELWFGALGEVRSFLHLTGEIGVGGAIVVNDELLRGAHGFAGEIGHMAVDENGPLCRCGSHGCLEQYAGQSALLRAAGLEDGKRPGRGGAAATAGGISGVEELARRADAGEARAVAAVEEAGRKLGVALSGAVNLLDPEVVVLGGIYPRLMPRLGPAVDAELARRVVSGLWHPTAGRLRPASTSADAARGAAAVVIREVLADPLAYSP